MREIESAEVCNVGAFSTALSATNIFRGRRNIYLEAIRDNIHMDKPYIYSKQNDPFNILTDAIDVQFVSFLM